MGQGVATIVMGAGVVAFGEALGGGSVVAGLVQGHALPLAVLEVPRGLGRALLLQQALALLVRTQPQVVEVQGVAGLGQAQAQQRQAEQPTPAPGAGGQQQQWQQQPIALVGPGVQAQGLAVVAHAPGSAQQAQAAQVVVVQAGLAIAPADFADELLEPGAVQARDQDRALVVLEVAAIVQRHRSPVAAANTQHQQLRAIAVQGLANALALLFAEGRGQQQHPPLAEGALVQQLEGLAQGQVGALAGLGHDRRLEGIEQVAAGGQVIGQRHQGVGAAGIDHDGGLGVAAQGQQVQQLVPGLVQAVGRYVAGEHLWRQFQQHHQRVGGFLAGLLDPLPAGPQQREYRQQPGQAQGDPGQLALAAVAAAEQGGMEGRWQDHLPAAGAFLPVPELPQQQGQQWQYQQPPGPEPMGPESDHRRLRRRRRLRRCRQ